ncbi:hypothetical protein [Nannocystis radixulma]|uniref:Uncharacterized protein n=1 Tax=Nannocystis radixulma TaxID=2995305 RepID=A0ABT5BEY4_9BACT|nr:hypothetical protein [Nannocystis radixulma]MDC0672706.1 hypothetical protein [Nannocystis radixulma]
MTYAMSQIAGALVGVVMAAAAWWWTCARPRLSRGLAALVLALGGAALVPALMRVTLSFDMFAPPVRALAERAVMFDVAAAVVGVVGGVCLAAGRSALAGTAGLAVLYLTRRYLTASAAWSLALWDEVVVEPRLVVDVGVDVAIALLLIGGAIAGARRAGG